MIEACLALELILAVSNAVVEYTVRRNIGIFLWLMIFEVYLSSTDTWQSQRSCGASNRRREWQNERNCNRTTSSSFTPLYRLEDWRLPSAMSGIHEFEACRVGVSLAPNESYVEELMATLILVAGGSFCGRYMQLLYMSERTGRGMVVKNHT